jgi:arabinogalactan oligomer/maltooligosaccharide transport system permease protein
MTGPVLARTTAAEDRAARRRRRAEAWAEAAGRVEGLAGQDRVPGRHRRDGVYAILVLLTKDSVVIAASLPSASSRSTSST